jgi:hypothetical protein
VGPSAAASSPPWAPARDGPEAPGRRRAGRPTAGQIIAAVDTEAGYQRDDWRGITSALQRRTASRVVMSSQFGAGPMDIYMPTLANVAMRQS